MLCLSQTAGYAILALSCIAENPECVQQTKDIADATGIPRAYLSKILSVLAQHDLVSAKRGTHGGFKLTLPSSQLSLATIVEAVEGRNWLPECLLGLADCSDLRACPTHAFWVKKRAEIENKLRRVKLSQVAKFEEAARTRSGKSRPVKRSAGRGNPARETAPRCAPQARGASHDEG